jgi:hypothetical protein
MLLSCVNTALSLIGFNLDADAEFWFAPADRLQACGACLADDALFIAADNTLTRISAADGIRGIQLPGPHRNLAHSVHIFPDMGIAVADTGNSRVLLYGFDLSGWISFDPLESWPQTPEDALHLNDTIWTPHGIVAFCLNCRPFREYFLRGIMPLADGSLLLEGSSLRRQDSKGMALLHVMPDGAVHTYPVARTGEIYVILPWRSALMRSLCPQITALPPALEDAGQEYPPPCILPDGY